MGIRIKNSEMIKAWADGETIQVWNDLLNDWVDTSTPTWSKDNTYRIKPEQTEVEFEDPSDDIDDILDCFDFERVKKVMDFLDWQWYDCGVPEIWDLRKKARVLLNDVWNAVRKEAEKSPDKEERYSIANGGFYVEAIKYSESPKVYLSLKFQIADWDNWC